MAHSRSAPHHHLHVAVVMPRYVDLILRGEKTVEARLTRQPRPPFGVVTPGERIYFKVRSGPVAATAVVASVEAIEVGGAEDVRRLRRAYEPRVRGGRAYWDERVDARYATLIAIERPEQVAYGPPGAVPGGMANRSAWRLLPVEADVYPACVAPDLFSSRASG